MPNAQYTGGSLLSRFVFKLGRVRYGINDVAVGHLSFDAASQLRIFMFGTNCGAGYCGSSNDPRSLYFVYDSQASADRFSAVQGPPVEGLQSYGVGSINLIGPAGKADPFESDL